ncbi:MAG TPA: LysM domain-containing protein [Polyangium sp.]|nr:LysM domain-containing protein [Polyangium sp.]
MFEVKSRYYNIETATFATTDGRMIAYKRRRFLPASGAALVLAEVTPGAGERLDLLTARTLGDPEAFWRICDANDTLSPFELTGLETTLRIPAPQV